MKYLILFFFLALVGCTLIVIDGGQELQKTTILIDQGTGDLNPIVPPDQITIYPYRNYWPR